jgi:uncharacterized protein
MEANRIFSLYILIIIFLVVSAHPALAGDIKKRMELRVPIIKSLKIQGVIGENNRGYLSFVSNKKVQEDVIAAENIDRKKIYAYLAKQQKITIEIVEQIQAQRKAKKADPGEFFQKPDGEWIKK